MENMEPKITTNLCDERGNGGKRMYCTDIMFGSVAIQLNTEVPDSDENGEETYHAHMEHVQKQCASLLGGRISIWDNKEN